MSIPQVKLEELNEKLLKRYSAEPVSTYVDPTTTKKLIPTWPEGVPRRYEEWVPQQIPKEDRGKVADYKRRARSYWGVTSEGNIATPAMKWNDDIVPIGQAISAIGLVVFGGIAGIKTAKDVYNYARIGKVVKQLKPKEARTLFTQMQKGNYPEFVKDVRGELSGKLVRERVKHMEPFEEYKVRPLFQKLERLWSKTGIPTKQIVSRGTLEMFSGPGVPEKAKKAIEQIPQAGKAAEAAPLAMGAIKPRIHKAVGLRTVGDYLKLNEKQALRRLLQRQRAASQEGFKAGLQKGKGISTEKIQVYKKKFAEAQTEQECRNLVVKLRAEQKASKEGYRFGKKEVQEIIRERNKVNRLVKSLKTLSKAKLPLDYEQKLNTLLSPYDLHKRSRKTLWQREHRREYLEAKEPGEMFLPKKVLRETFQKSLGEMTPEELREVYLEASMIVERGRLKGTLFSNLKARNYEKVVSTLRETINKNFIKPKHSPTDRALTPSERRHQLGTGVRGVYKKTAESLDGLMATLKKPEAIIESFDGYRPGGVGQKTLFRPVNNASNAELVRKHYTGKTIKGVVDGSGIDWTKAYLQQDKIEGSYLNKVEQITTYLNSKNLDNRLHMMAGYGWSDEKIDKIVANLSPKEKKFANQIMEIAGSNWGTVSEITTKLVGRPPERVDNYWPIHIDRKLADPTMLKERDRNLFKDIIRRKYVSRGFTFSRKGGLAPVELDFFKVLTRHMDETNHFITHALPVRDVNKLLRDARMKDSIKNAVGEGEYNQLTDWIQHVASPKQLAYNPVERVSDFLRANTTMSMLGLKASVSLKQAGSYFLTLNRLSLDAGAKEGWKNTAQGTWSYFRHPKQIKEFVYKHDPATKYRRENFDLEMRDYIDRTLSKKRGWTPDKRNMLFTFIAEVDKHTVLTAWSSAFIQGNKMFRGDKTKMIEYASTVARRTQPTALPHNLAKISRGPAFQKLFTMFYTHFSNAYNEASRTGGMLKQKKISKAKAFASYITQFLGPALLTYAVTGGILKKEGVGKKAIAIGKGVAGYALGIYPVVGNLINSFINSYDYRVTPVEMIGVEAGKAIKAKGLETKIKAGAKAVGYTLGFPTPQGVITYEGTRDLITGKTQNPLRLILSKYQLGETAKTDKTKTLTPFEKKLLKRYGK